MHGMIRHVQGLAYEKGRIHERAIRIRGVFQGEESIPWPFAEILNVHLKIQLRFSLYLSTNFPTDLN